MLQNIYNKIEASPWFIGLALWCILKFFPVINFQPQETKEKSGQNYGKSSSPPSTTDDKRFGCPVEATVPEIKKKHDLVMGDRCVELPVL